MGKEGAGKVKTLLVVNWNINAKAFLKKMKLDDIELPKKGSIVDLVQAKNDGYTIAYKPGQGLIGMASKAKLHKLMGFLTDFHAKYNVPYTDNEDNARVTAHFDMPEEVAEKYGFVRSDDAWEYNPDLINADTEADEVVEEDEEEKPAKKKAKKPVKTEKAEKGEKTKAVKKTTAAVKRRNPEQLAELLATAATDLVTIHELHPIFKIAIDEVLERSGYKRLAKPYMTDLKNILNEEYDVLVDMDDKYMYIVVMTKKVRSQAIRVKKTDMKEAEKTLISKALEG